MDNFQNTTRIPELALPTVNSCGTGTMRLVPIGGDTMEPTLKRGDAVAVVPVTRFSYDSLYVVDVDTTTRVYRCSSDFCGGVVLSNDNKAYSSLQMSRDEFAEIVIGQVAVLCRVIDRSLLDA